MTQTGLHNQNPLGTLLPTLDLPPCFAIPLQNLTHGPDVRSSRSRRLKPANNSEACFAMGRINLDGPSKYSTRSFKHLLFVTTRLYFPVSPQRTRKVQGSQGLEPSAKTPRPAQPPYRRRASGHGNGRIQAAPFPLMPTTNLNNGYETCARAEES